MFCNKGYSEAYQLKQHIKFVHNKERPYQCQHCEKAFSTAIQLGQHMQYHTGNFRYQCPVCEKCFITGQALTKHGRNSKSCRSKYPALCKTKNSGQHQVPSPELQQLIQQHQQTNQEQSQSNTQLLLVLTDVPNEHLHLELPNQQSTTTNSLVLEQPHLPIQQHPITMQQPNVEQYQMLLQQQIVISQNQLIQANQQLHQLETRHTQIVHQENQQQSPLTSPQINSLPEMASFSQQIFTTQIKHPYS